jgi:arginine decarboxylase
MKLYNKLLEYSKEGIYPMHMPGHKRNTELASMVNPYSLDITEIEGFDNLHSANEILLECMNRAANLYGSKYTNYLVGGSTAGILAGIASCTKKGDKVIVARNSHKSVYNAIYLNELKPIYVYPKQVNSYGINGDITTDDIKEILCKNSDIKLIIITSPTYEGIISDIKSISKIAHEYGIPLLVDEAHGAHLGFHRYFPENSIKAGADIVIHSLHKTLPSFTQTGLIHINSRFVSYEVVKRYLSIYQTSSPSYLLMASIDQCISMLEKNRDELFTRYSELLSKFYIWMEQLKYIKIMKIEDINTEDIKIDDIKIDDINRERCFNLDPSKLIISVKNTNINGNQLYYKLLNDYKIQMEMVSNDYVLGMTSICDTWEGFTRLGEALLTIDATLPNSDITVLDVSNNDMKEIRTGLNNRMHPEIVLTSYDAFVKESKMVILSESVDQIAAEYVYLYPPGIPLLVPGERISGDMILNIFSYIKNGLTVHGLYEGQNIKVIS